MPEGDSIHRTAAALRIALVDKKMVRFDAPHLIGVVPKAGRTIVRVESGGKHLEIEWDDGIILHTLLRKSGFWDLYRKDDIWQRPHREMRALIETAAWVAVCFNAPTVETFREPGISRHPWFGRLGPDLCSVDADLDRCVELLAVLRRPARPDLRGAPRSTGVRRRRQRVPQRGAVGVRAAPVRPGGRHRRSARPAHRQRRRPAVAGEPLPRRAGRPARRAWRSRRLRAHRSGLLPLRRRRCGPARAARTNGSSTGAPAARRGSPRPSRRRRCPTDQHPAAKAFRDDTPWPTAG